MQAAEGGTHTGHEETFIAIHVQHWLFRNDNHKTDTEEEPDEFARRRRHAQTVYVIKPRHKRDARVATAYAFALLTSARC